MRLSATQITAVKQELSADPLEEENPAMDSLRNAFGDHTFYVGSDGLFVFEPVNDPAHPGEPAQLVLVATWTDDQKNALQPVPPQATERVFDLATSEAGGNSEGEAS